MTVRFTTFPRTSPPPAYVVDVAEAFRAHEGEIDTIALRHDSLKSDDLLRLLRPRLEDLGFEVERGKKKAEKIHPTGVLWGRRSA